MNKKSNYINREISWLEFNKRVLEEAYNKNNPLIERLNFLGISGSNLDEFFMVRVAGLKGQVDSNIYIETIDGTLPSESLREVIEKSKLLKKKQDECWLQLLSELDKKNIKIKSYNALNLPERNWLKNYFKNEVFALLTPLAIDTAHPFPFVPNLGLSLVFKLASNKNKKIVKVVLPVPRTLNKFIKINKSRHFIRTEQLIILFINIIFPDYKYLSSGAFRIIRDSDIEFNDEAEDLVTTFENQLKKRRFGRVIILEVSRSMPLDLRNMIVNTLKIKKEYVIASNNILDCASVSDIVKESPYYRWKEYEPRFPERVRDAKNNIFSAIRQKDMIIHHPYESFEVVVKFLRQAAKDKKVLVIKQTIYRTAKENNAIIEALVEAAEEGKSVTALLEIKARFDEEANIKVARHLKRYGVQVVYGSIELKTHAKISLVIRRERSGLKSYVHFGTGNYHILTAKRYTDLSLFTCNNKISKDAQDFFNMATGYAYPKKWNALSVAPKSLRNDFINLIKEEIEYKKSGKESEIWIKCNSLTDELVINSLYEASKNGVRVELIVRGVCCLRPQVKNLSENIHVRSIVGRFLEHSRIYCFSGGGRMPSMKAKVFISSADIMPRNFDRRYEVMVPILNKTVHKQILNQIMVVNLNDNSQAWEMNSNGSYERIKNIKNLVSAHNYFMSNPSLSGRGESIKKNRPEEITLKK